jgi:hypothetical protein
MAEQLYEDLEPRSKRRLGPPSLCQPDQARALLRLVEQVQQCHPETRHRRGPPCGGFEQLHLDHTVAFLSKAFWIYTTTRDTTDGGPTPRVPSTRSNSRIDSADNSTPPSG